MLRLTESAGRKLSEVLAQQAEHGKSWYGLRLRVEAGCCSGPRYGLSLTEREAEGDWVGEFGGLRVLVDRDSAPQLQGLCIDFIETPEGSGFTVENPNALPVTGAPRESGGGCGCGGQ